MKGSQTLRPMSLQEKLESPKFITFSENEFRRNGRLIDKKAKNGRCYMFMYYRKFYDLIRMLDGTYMTAKAYLRMTAKEEVLSGN